MRKSVTSIDYKEIVNKHANAQNLSQCIEGKKRVRWTGGIWATKQSRLGEGGEGPRDVARRGAWVSEGANRTKLQPSHSQLLRMF